MQQAEVIIWQWIWIIGCGPVSATTGTHALYVHKRIHTNKTSLLIAPAVCPILTQSLLKKKKNNNVTFQTMPPYAVHCVACAANKSLLSVSRHWTGCSCHYRFFTLPASQVSQQHWFTGEYRRYFLPQQTLSVPFLPSLSALSVPPVRVTIPSLSLFHSAVAAKAERSCQHTLLFFDSCFFSFSLSPSNTVVEWTAPWQHWQLKTFICLSCTLCVFFLCCVLFFMFLQVNVMQAGVPGKQMALRKRKKVKV